MNMYLGIIGWTVHWFAAVGRRIRLIWELVWRWSGVRTIYFMGQRNPKILALSIHIVKSTHKASWWVKNYCGNTRTFECSLFPKTKRLYIYHIRGNLFELSNVRKIWGDLFKLPNIGVCSKARRGFLPLVGRPGLCIFTGEEILLRSILWQIWENYFRNKKFKLIWK